MLRKSGPKVCGYPKCGRRVKARGYCNGHYQQIKGKKGLRPLQKKRGADGCYRGETLCSFTGCGHGAASWGLCDGHYQQAQSGGRLSPLQVIREGCSITGCPAPHEGRGYCRKHYDKWRRYGDPLHQGRKDPSPIEDRGDHLAIPLGGKNGKGLEALIDKEDRPLTEGKRWWASGEKKAEERYAMCKIDGRQVSMHRLLLGLSCDDLRQGDHANGVRMDNRRENLRIVDFPEQMQNKRPWGKSGHRNVFWEAKKELWRVIVIRDGTRYYGGRHKKIEDAVEAARELRAKLHTHHNEDRTALPCP